MEVFEYLEEGEDYVIANLTDFKSEANDPLVCRRTLGDVLN